jgi:DNA-binding CsgD family transcriptional regulator
MPQKFPLLSDREAQLLTLFCDGNTHKEIAREMGINVKTVSVHLYNIRAKAGKAKTDVQLYKWAQKNMEEVNV